jgi:hypothetical protein
VWSGDLIGAFGTVRRGLGLGEGGQLHSGASKRGPSIGWSVVTETTSVNVNRSEGPRSDDVGDHGTFEGSAEGVAGPVVEAVLDDAESRSGPRRRQFVVESDVTPPAGLGRGWR